MEKGDDELAKEALKRRKSNQENADTMKSQLDQQRKAVDQLISNTKCAPCLLLCEACMPSAAVIPALEWSYESLFCFVPQRSASVYPCPQPCCRWKSSRQRYLGSVQMGCYI